MQDEEMVWALVRCPNVGAWRSEQLRLARKAPRRGLLGLVLTALVLGAAVLLASPASACWDGYAAGHENVTVMGGGDNWNPETARQLATWLPRIAALMGEKQLDVYWGQADIEGGPSVEFPGERFDVLFRRLATVLGASRAERRTAMTENATPLTIQIGASRDRSRAEALVERLSRNAFGEPGVPEGLFDEHGFYEAGGFPASNAAAHLLVRTEADGSEVFQVVVGAFLTRASAETVVASLRADHGIDGFVRGL